MELKTMKDLRKKMSDATLKQYGISSLGIVSVEDLKQEAIKWINKMDIDKDFGEVSNRHAYRREEYLKISRNIKQWIKHFFNIEESDIKNG